MYPWPSFGGFLFTTDERALFETDAGWVRTPAYDRTRAFGTATDVITATSIGSAERTFELMLTPERFAALETMLNSKAVFTDWTRPVPDSRLAFMTEITALGDVVSSRVFAPNTAPSPGFMPRRKRHVRLTFVTA